MKEDPWLSLWVEPEQLKIRSDKEINIALRNKETSNRADVIVRRVAKFKNTISNEANWSKKKSDIITKALSTVEAKAKMSSSAKKVLSDVEYLSRRTALINEANKKPEVIARRKAAAKKNMQNPETKRKMAETWIKNITETRKLRPKLSNEEKLLYKQALAAGLMENTTGKGKSHTLSATAKYFNVNYFKLLMYSKGENLRDLE